VRLAKHVAVRRFPGETVILNLVTGDYHGLDAMGTAFFEALQRNPDLSSAVEELAGAYDVDSQELEKDMQAFCGGLVERGLIEVKPDGVA